MKRRSTVSKPKGIKVVVHSQKTEPLPVRPQSAGLPTMKEVAISRAVVAQSYKHGWVTMAAKGWRCVEGTYTANDKEQRQGE
jgi:hypothetical protein